jgi:hypothetical protein
MARPPSVAGGRPVPVATKLSHREVALLDDLRGSLSRAEYLRWLILKAESAGLKMPDTPDLV